ncbi:hypothetical protein M514_24904 [Trichuris suis]|uniref:Uncharacterized protein n=1 Tax=Trichuris suis TaxID=68888 RepID=A0A085N0H1_9BILA|nr:hypothetical protein M514_24904 [Trichuris suis]
MTASRGAMAGKRLGNTVLYHHAFPLSGATGGHSSSAAIHLFQTSSKSDHSSLRRDNDQQQSDRINRLVTSNNQSILSKSSSLSGEDFDHYQA